MVKNIPNFSKNFNAKRSYNKSRTRGKGMLPEKISLKEFKARYSDKPLAEIKKQLALYKTFGERDSLDLAFPETDSRLSKWEANFFKVNREKTKKFYDEEIADLERIIGDKPYVYSRQNERLINLQRKREKLDKDLSTLSEDEIKSLRNVYTYAERSDLVKEQGFRHYLNQLERTMKNLGYSKTEINELLNKFNVLSENEFFELVQNENLIDAVYDIIDSPKSRGKYELMTDEERARDIVEEIKERADSLISKYKSSK